MDEEIRYFTNGELRTLSRCKRKWWLAHYRKLKFAREERKGVRKLGTRLHLALAELYQPGGEGTDIVQLFIDSFHEDYDFAASQGDTELYAALEKDQDLGVRMLQGYLQWVEEEGVDQGLEVYATEAEVAAPITYVKHPRGVPVVLRGKLDVRATRELDGARLFLDHKSVGSFTEATAMLPQDHQMLTYHLLEVLEQTSRGVPPDEVERCDGALYNMLRRVKRTAAAKPPFFARETVHHNTQQLRNHYKQTVGRIKEILALEVALDAGGDHQELCPPHVEASCSWSCDYLPACALFDDGSNVEGFLERYYVGYDPDERYIQSDDLVEDEG